MARLSVYRKLGNIRKAIDAMLKWTSQMGKLLQITVLRRLLKISFLLLMVPTCIFGIQVSLLMFGIAFAETSAHNMEPSLPFNAQLVSTNNWSGSDGAGEQKTYYCSADLNQVLTVMEQQRGHFTKLVDPQGQEVYSNIMSDRSLPMQIVSQAGSKDGIPAPYPSVEIRIRSGRGTDPTGTTIIVAIGWSP